jgi:hypothetical protein
MTMLMLKHRIREFLKDEDATLSAEAAIILPILLWAYGGMYVFWDAFKMQNINVKSAYTIADMLSREVVNITPDYIDGMMAMHSFLNRDRYETRLRVSVVGLRLDSLGAPELILCWSEARGTGMERHRTVDTIEDRIPMMAVGTEVIVVETEMDYIPLLRRPYGLDERTFTNFIPTRPRFQRGQVGFTPSIGPTRTCLNPQPAV